MLKEVELFDVYHETIDKLSANGILLVAGDPPNPMTIGWGTFGHIWNKQIITVLVRPVRYTFGLMESVNDFSVCVLPDQFRNEIAFCGTRSGLELNKIEACNFTALKCIKAQSFYLAESRLHFECRIVHKHRLDPLTMDTGIIKRYYPEKDFHMVYYGEILGIYRKE